MRSALWRERHFALLVATVFAFCVAASFFFAPFFLAESNTGTLIVVSGVGMLYGYFTANFVFDLDHVTKHHHAGLWATALSGAMLGALVVNDQLRSSDWWALLPAGNGLYRYALLFALSYCLAYTAWLLYREEHDPLGL